MAATCPGGTCPPEGTRAPRKTSAQKHAAGDNSGVEETAFASLSRSGVRCQRYRILRDERSGASRHAASFSKTRGARRKRTAKTSIGMQTALRSSARISEAEGPRRSGPAANCLHRGDGGKQPALARHASSKKGGTHPHPQEDTWTRVFTRETRVLENAGGAPLPRARQWSRTARPGASRRRRGRTKTLYY